MTESTDHYAVLGVDVGADEHEVTKAYRRLARELHPDVNPDPDAQERFTAVAMAAEVLQDPARRALHDAQRTTSRPEARFRASEQSFSVATAGDVVPPAPISPSVVFANIEAAFLRLTTDARSTILDFDETVLEWHDGRVSEQRSAARRRAQRVRRADEDLQAVVDEATEARRMAMQESFKRYEETVRFERETALNRIERGATPLKPELAAAMREARTREAERNMLRNMNRALRDHLRNAERADGLWRTRVAKALEKRQELVNLAHGMEIQDAERLHETQMIEMEQIVLGRSTSDTLRADSVTQELNGLKGVNGLPLNLPSSSEPEIGLA